MSTFIGALLLATLVLTLAGCWRAILQFLGEGRDVVASAGTMATLAVADVPGALFGDVRVGALIATVLVAMVVAGLTPVMHRRVGPPLQLAPSWTTGEYASAFVVAGLLAWCAVTSWMWDEASTHLPLGNAVARGVLPLEHPAFPGERLRYHAGYAVLVGVVRAFTQLPVDVCADIVTLAGVVVLVQALRDVLRALGASAATAAVGIVVVLCAGGPLAGLLADGWGAPLPGKALLPSAWVNGATFPPLVVTNVLQHPQGLAMPIALAVVLLLTDRQGTGRVVVATLLVVLLARIQILFSAFTGLLLAGAIVVDVVHRERRAILHLAIVVGGGGFALGAGGLGAGSVDALLWGRGYFAADGALAVVHVLLAFGLTLLSLPAAVVVARRAPPTLRPVVVGTGLLGLLGIVVGNMAVYERSWDIVKFFGVGAFFGHVAIALALPRLPRAVVIIVLALSCWSGVFWLLRHGPLQGVVAPAARERGIDATASVVDDTCGHLIPGTARVFASRKNLWQAGWLVPGTDWRSSRDTRALLLDRARVDADIAAWTRAQASLDDEALRQIDVAYVALDGRDRRRHAATLASPRFRELCRAGDTVVFEVVR
jgi:hypothetical protein